jgi:hypothetical protein
MNDLLHGLDILKMHLNSLWHRMGNWYFRILTQHQINPLTAKFASISAVYNEDITDSIGNITSHDGYYKGIAHQTSKVGNYAMLIGQVYLLTKTCCCMI